MMFLENRRAIVAGPQARVEAWGDVMPKPLPDTARKAS